MLEYGVSLRVFLMGADGHAHVEPGLAEVIFDLESAARTVSREVNRSGLVGIHGYADSTNVHGEEVKKLDLYANELMVFAMRLAGRVCGMASEEVEEIIEPSEEGKNSEYVVLFDPLDGSSNIEVNLSIGTIWSIYKRKTPVGEAATTEDFLQRGTEQVAAGYFMYGASTMLVLTAGRGVHAFTFDSSIGSFHLCAENIRTPDRGSIYSCNEGNMHRFDAGSQRYLESLKDPSAGKGRPYSARYVGALVADFHRNLQRGGIFLYPAVAKKPGDTPAGKLRLMYEANPLAFLVEEAGGKATDGTNRILDIEPTDIHQKVPLIIGSAEDVDEYGRYFAEAGPASDQSKGAA